MRNGQNKFQLDLTKHSTPQTFVAHPFQQCIQILLPIGPEKDTKIYSYPINDPFLPSKGHAPEIRSSDLTKIHTQIGKLILYTCSIVSMVHVEH